MPFRRCCYRAERRNQSHNAHVLTNVTVHYRWHALWGTQLQCRRQIAGSDGDYLDCELPDGAGAQIPVWMTDPVVCAGFSFGTPVASVEALVELRSLLDSMRADQNAPTDTGQGMQLFGEEKE
jgi:hypothetical protein